MARKKLADVTVNDVVSYKTNVGRYQPYYYAGASGDFNPIHIDPEFAKMVGLGGNILQGLCSMAFVAKMNTDWAGDPGALKRIKVRFASPVRPEDVITVKGTVSKVTGQRAKIDMTAVNQDGTEVITMAFAEVELDTD